MIICQKCNKEQEREWYSGETYEGIDSHHSPPTFMMKENWKGDLISLCRDCHKEIHIQIRKIMFKNSNLFKMNNSDYFLWLQITPQDRRKTIEEVIKFTREWLNDPKTIETKRI